MAKIEVKKILRIGSSYCVSISKPLLLGIGVVQSDYVSMRLTGDKIEIKKLSEGKK